jgi:hypothetical protein
MWAKNEGLCLFPLKMESINKQKKIKKLVMELQTIWSTSIKCYLIEMLFFLFLSLHNLHTLLLGSYSSMEHKIATIEVESFFLLSIRVLFSFSNH